MRKLISSSLCETIEESIGIAKEFNCGIEVSRLPKNIDFDLDFENVCKYFKKIFIDFQNEVSFHGLFYDLSVASDDPAIKKISEKRYEQSLQYAKASKAKTLLFHTNFKPVKHIISQTKFKEETILFWQKFIKNIENEGIIAVLENVSEYDYHFIDDIIRNVNSPNLKAALDTGHVNVHSKVDVCDWINSYGKNLAHLHIHNNFGDNDSHLSILNGTLNFNNIFDTIINNKINPSIVFEIFNINSVKESFEFFDNYFNQIRMLNK